MTEFEFLQTYDISQYPRPSVTADILTFALSRNQKDVRRIPIDGIQVLLVKRAEHPSMGKWALPGGFVQPHESVQQAAHRVLQTETGIATELQLINTYSGIDRDPRGWIISNAFYGIIDKQNCILRTDDTAWETAWFTLVEHEVKQVDGHADQTLHRYYFESEKDSFLIQTIVTKQWTGNCFTHQTRLISSELAFDHDLILFETIQELTQTLKHDLRPLFRFFPETFTIRELQTVYELLTETQHVNFRRTIQPYVIETDEEVVAGYRPPKLYKRNLDAF